MLLAAGEGTRLRPLTEHCPKPMLTVGGTPMLEHLVALLRAYGVTEIAINLHYKPQSIVSHFGDGSRFGVSITYSYEAELLGSAGAARNLDRFLDETFFVLYGDVLTDIDLAKLAQQHRARSAAMTLALYEVEDPSRCGIVRTREDGKVEAFVEKPGLDQIVGRFANAGVYVAEPEILAHIPRHRPSDFGHDLIPELLRRRAPIYAFPTDAYVLDIGSPERYAQAEADFATGRYRGSRHQELVGAERV